MSLKLPDRVIEVIVKALENGDLIQKQACLCDLAALDAIPSAILSYLKLHHQKAIAISPTTSSRIQKKLSRFIFNKNSNYNKFPDDADSLRKLAQSEHWKIRIKVAENPNTPIDVLENLANDNFNNGVDAFFVREAVAINPAASVEILEKLARDSSKSVRNRVASNPSTPILLLERLAQSATYGVIRNPRTPGHVLKDIAKSINDIMWLEKIAKHNNTPPETLAELSTRNLGMWSGRLRIAIAENINTPSQTLAELATDPYQQNWAANDGKSYIHFLVQIAVASNPNTPVEVLKLFFQERELFKCQALAKNPKIPIDLVRYLDTEDDYVVYQSPPYPWKKKSIKNTWAFQNFMDIMHWNLAQHPNLPIDMIEKLAQHRNFYVRKSTFENINTPLYILEKMTVCSNSKEKIQILNRIRSIYKEIGANPETSTEELQKILNHQDIEVRQIILLHPQGLNLLLARCLKPERCLPEQNSLNRVLAGMYPEISQEQMDNLFYSENWFDRLAVACNPNISQEHLVQLTEDKNNFIRQIAKELLLERHN